MKHLLFFTVTILFLPIVQAQNVDSLLRVLEGRRKVMPTPKGYTVPDPSTYGSMITATEMDQMIAELASDAMSGRETGTLGQEIAADYIAKHFDTLGLTKVGDQGTFFQYFHLENEKWTKLELDFAGERMRNLREFYIVPGEVPDSLMLQAKGMVYAGYGAHTPLYSDYKRSKVKGKIVVLEAGEPISADGRNASTGTNFKSDLSYNVHKKAEIAAKLGARAVIYIDPKFEENVNAKRAEYAGYGWTAKKQASNAKIPIIYISQKRADLLLKDVQVKISDKKASAANGKSGKAFAVSAPIKLFLKKEKRKLDGSNVMGFLEGADPAVKDEVIAITAHYDHLGLHDGKVHGGADDNASGTAGVMEMAESFMAAARAGIKPKRSIMFMLVSGEEKGLLGSEFYTEFPVFPLQKTVCNINTDMIGRVDPIHEGNPNYIYVIGADRLSSQLHAINEEMNSTYTKMELDYRFNAIDDPNHYYERSDHYNFAKNGIPSIFYFNGVHADYHKATDTADKIDEAAAAKRTQLAFYTAWELAHRPTRIVVDKK
jgi:Peptidase family M28/PA domain